MATSASRITSKEFLQGSYDGRVMVNFPYSFSLFLFEFLIGYGAGSDTWTLARIFGLFSFSQLVLHRVIWMTSV